MGTVSSVPSGANPVKFDWRTCLQTLPDYSWPSGKQLKNDHFLKSIQCRHLDGLVVLKVYVKWRQKKKDLESLGRFQAELERFRELVNPRTMPNILPYQRLFDPENNKVSCAFLVRQYLKFNLYDRCTSLPTLSMTEKKWIAYQLLESLRQIHQVQLCHGDIKSENVLLTSTNWVYLVDFAPFKPAYLPDNDPAAYYYFFENKGERHSNPCYLAPERFYSSSVGSKSKTSTPRGGSNSGSSNSGSSNSVATTVDIGSFPSSPRSSRSPALSPANSLGSKMPPLDVGESSVLTSGSTSAEDPCLETGSKLPPAFKSWRNYMCPNFRSVCVLNIHISL